MQTDRLIKLDREIGFMKPCGYCCFTYLYESQVPEVYDKYNQSPILQRKYLDSAPREELPKHLNLQPFQYKGLVNFFTSPCPPCVATWGRKISTNSYRAQRNMKTNNIISFPRGYPPILFINTFPKGLEKAAIFNNSKVYLFISFCILTWMF